MTDKITISRELLRQALEAIELNWKTDEGDAVKPLLRAALAEQELNLYAGLGVPLFPVEPQAKVLLTDDYGKPDQMPDEAWRQLTQVIPFRVRQVMNGHLHSIDVLHESLNRVADYCLDGYGWSTGQWKPIGQYGVAIEQAVRKKAGLK